jgi:transposase-like protein
VDETYVKVAGNWHYVYRAVDQFGLGVCPWTPDQTRTTKRRGPVAPPLEDAPG